MRKKIWGENWDAVMYPVAERKDKVMIVMSGSDGGLNNAQKLAAFMQQKGIPALALGYFKTKHSNKHLSKIPLEIIEEAINWLRKEGYQKIGIEGVSKGTEYALAAAIEFHDISCVIVKTPSRFYSEGMIGKKPSGTSCWSFKGKELPFTPYKTRKFNLIKMLWKTKEYNILEINVGKEVQEESIIPIEKVKAPILMLSAEKDTVWPSKESAEIMYTRLKQNEFGYPFKHICFPNMSHMMLENCGRAIKYLIKSENEYPEECAKERVEMGEICVDWIENVWK